MSKYRVSFLVWWTTIVLFIASFIWVNRTCYRSRPMT
jgi:hypothetical protein